MHKLDTGKFTNLDRALRKIAQPIDIFARELFAGPERRQSGDWIELLEIHQAADGLVVIPPDEDVPQRLYFRDDFVGLPP